MQGPITVFDDGVYAGDAKIQDLPPGSERLISYAMDLNTEVAIESKPQADQLVSVSLAKGMLQITHKLQRSQTYTAKNSSRKAKQLLIEYPYDGRWKLVTPEKPAEKARDHVSFCPPGRARQTGEVDRRGGANAQPADRRQ